MIIVLIGYMGSGKSTVGKELAKKLNFNFLDLDNYIENKYNSTISDIFDIQGEIYFRKIESECVREICKKNENIIFSLGGGTPCYGNIMTYLLNSSVISVYLKGSISTIFKRLLIDKNKRPLISNIDELDLKEFIAKHLFERSKFYNKADHIISIDSFTTKQLVDRLKFLTLDQ